MKENLWFMLQFVMNENPQKITILWPKYISFFVVVAERNVFHVRLTLQISFRVQKFLCLLVHS